MGISWSQSATIAVGILFAVAALAILGRVL
jgi:hypothetical protein